MYPGSKEGKPTIDLTGNDPSSTIGKCKPIRNAARKSTPYEGACTFAIYFSVRMSEPGRHARLHTTFASQTTNFPYS